MEKGEGRSGEQRLVLRFSILFTREVDLVTRGRWGLSSGHLPSLVGQPT